MEFFNFERFFGPTVSGTTLMKARTGLTGLVFVVDNC